MTTIRAMIARAALLLAYRLAPPTSEASRVLGDAASTLGSGGAGPWRPR
jgi:hypothetical protein